MLCHCRKIVSLLCLFLVLPFLIWPFQLLQRRVLMVMTPSWWRLFCFIPCGGREAEFGSIVNPLIKDDVGQLVSGSAPVATLVTSSHAPVSVSASGASSSVSLSSPSNSLVNACLFSRFCVTPMLGLLWNTMRMLNMCRLGARVFRFSSLNVPSCVSAEIVHDIYELTGVPWYSFMCLLVKVVSSCAIRPDKLFAASL